MSREPMKPIPEGFFPPGIKTPEERFEFLGRRLFKKNPAQLKGDAEENNSSGNTDSPNPPSELPPHLDKEAA